MYGDSKSMSDAAARNIIEPEQYSQDLTIDNGVQDNLGWDDSFQPSFANETTQINIPHLPQTSLPPLPPQQSTFVSQPEGVASFQPPVYPFNEDLLPGPSSLPLEVATEPSKQSQPHEFQHKSALSGSRSSSPSDTDHEAALALEVSDRVVIPCTSQSLTTVNSQDMALNRHHARLKTIFAGTPAYSYRHLPPPSLGPLVSLQSVLSDWHRTPVLLPDLRSLRALTSDFLNK